MVKKLMTLLPVLVAVGVVLGACSQGAAPPAAKSDKPAAAPAGPAAKAGWEQEWQAAVAEGRKEGVVSVYALWGPATRTALTQGFRDKYGINVEFLPFARGAEIAARAQGEKNAGVYMADMFGAGGPTLITTIKPMGLLGPIEPLFVLPEVKDAKFWSGGKLPFFDQDKLGFGLIAAIQRYIMYNTDLVKKGEITTYRDVLKPQYKGKITMSDPRVTGTGNAIMSHLAVQLWSVDEAKDFLRQLIRQQEVVIQRDPRLNVESVARGKYAIGLAPHTDSLTEFVKLGAPVDVVFVKDGAYVSPGAGGMALPARFAHPNAARVFLNWLLSKEGQTIFARSFGFPSLRTDVSTEGINPIFLAQPGEKLFLQTEEYMVWQEKMLGIAAEVIQETMK